MRREIAPTPFPICVGEKACFDPTMQTPASRQAPPAIIFWVIWFAILSGLLVMQFFLGGGVPTGRNAPDASIPGIVFVPLGEVLLATLVRGLVLPRFVELPKKFVWMIIGLSLSEGAGILGIFLLPGDQPETKLLVFLLSLFSVLQFIPLYARGPART
jgi:hypothetical protein